MAFLINRNQSNLRNFERRKCDVTQMLISIFEAGNLADDINDTRGQHHACSKSNLLKMKKKTVKTEAPAETETPLNGSESKEVCFVVIVREFKIRQYNHY
jgi:hypothetical protein